jgi:hypothetical protein
VSGRTSKPRLKLGTLRAPRMPEREHLNLAASRREAVEDEIPDPRQKDPAHAVQTLAGGRRTDSRLTSDEIKPADKIFQKGTGAALAILPPPIACFFDLSGRGARR